jgi:hypothetical protein
VPATNLQFVLQPVGSTTLRVRPQSESTTQRVSTSGMGLLQEGTAAAKPESARGRIRRRSTAQDEVTRSDPVAKGDLRIPALGRRPPKGLRDVGLVPRVALPRKGRRSSLLLDRPSARLPLGT